MSRWCRVFGASENQPPMAAVLDTLRILGVSDGCLFKGDDQGWTAVTLNLEAGSSPLTIECYLASEPGVRADLNAWAAELETCDYSPHHAQLMERVIQTKQWFVMRRPLDHANESRLDSICEQLCRYLALRTDGVYQMDGVGFFMADGQLLLREY